ncbi:hypothetical protein B2J88_16000 [Rhodococcus sp. SRB_17]|uniref:hypothetical protein n=1 Tax=Rhodococcus sp. OK302 TaxID=1882769 RepID=UPI0015962683|nr:hypothetical protein [Rhodococcus sp. OK302]NMM85850.1 hypothetical protein [Rhodococcus sp. SRB_17]
MTVLLLWSVVGVPATADADVPAPHDAIAADTAAESGTFRALTYNIAGLPAVLSSARTDRPSSTTSIGARLAPYDVVNVQEDFNYHA